MQRRLEQRKQCKRTEGSAIDGEGSKGTYGASHPALRVVVITILTNPYVPRIEIRIGIVTLFSAILVAYHHCEQ